MLEQLNVKSSLDLLGRSVNISEDQKQPKSLDISLIQKIISGDTISVPQKDGQKFTFRPYTTMLISLNDVVDFKDRSAALVDRLAVIPFNKTFIAGANCDIHIEDRLCEGTCLQIIAIMAIQAFSKALQNGTFTIPPSVIEATNAYFMECNSASEFCSLYPIRTFVGKAEYRERCRLWCEDNDRIFIGKENFGKYVSSQGYRLEERYSFASVKHRNWYVAPNFVSSAKDRMYQEYHDNNVGSLNSRFSTFDEFLWGLVEDNVISFINYTGSSSNDTTVPAPADPSSRLEELDLGKIAEESSR